MGFDCRSVSQGLRFWWIQHSRRWFLRGIATLLLPPAAGFDLMATDVMVVAKASDEVVSVELAAAAVARLSGKA